VKEPKQDDERLAALLEGRVQGGQREDMLAHIAAADDDYEVFAGTAGVLRALEEEDARAGRRVPIHSMRKGGWRAPGMRTTALVTGTLVLLLALGLALRARDPSLGRTPQQLALAAVPDGQGLPVGWNPPTPSGGVRGAGRSADRGARAVLAGAMLVDLSVAVRARDTERIPMLAERLNRHADRGVGGTALRRIAAQPGAPADSLNALLDQAADRLADRWERKPLQVGAWLEAARLAARRQDSTFFQDGASDGMLRRAKRLARGDQAALAAVKGVDAALPTGGTPPRWDALEESLRRLLSELSG
jgi:hypothetical protein